MNPADGGRTRTGAAVPVHASGRTVAGRLRGTTVHTFVVASAPQTRWWLVDGLGLEAHRGVPTRDVPERLLHPSVATPDVVLAVVTEPDDADLVRRLRERHRSTRIVVLVRGTSLLAELDDVADATVAWDAVRPGRVVPVLRDLVAVRPVVLDELVVAGDDA